MAGSLNKVQIIGHLGKDPEVRAFQDGNKVCNFSVACTESWRDKNSGEKKERTEWVNVSVFQAGLIGVLEQYVRKGSKIYVEGKLQTRKWQDQNGNDRWSTEVVVQGFGGQIILLGESKGGGGSRDTSRDDHQAPSERQSVAADLDDAIPF